MNNIIKKYNIKAKKSLGQNFLINDEILLKITDFLNLKDKNIIEIWPWYGALSEKILSKNPKQLTMIELDSDMVEILENRISSKELYSQKTQINLLHQDILEYNPDIENYIVIANIPYYITSPILRHFLYEVDNKPMNMIIMMQSDVWYKILKKNKNKSCVLSLYIDKKSYSEEVIWVWKENFSPSPKIDSLVVSFELHKKYNIVDDKKFLDLIKDWFQTPRKKLIKNLLNAWYKKESILYSFDELWVEENIRGEDLDIQKWIELTKYLN